MRHEIAVQREAVHPNIMPILDYDDDHSHWYTMPIAVRVLRHEATPMPDRMILEMVREALEGWPSLMG